ncbi:MAG: hypothetical protein ACREF4_06875 [Gammaproteobacteria bacterium]
MIALHGHGIRLRSVVLANDSEGSATLGVVWTRRYRCRGCGVCCSVSASGVLPRFQYSLDAIVTAWLLVIAVPLGEGLDQLAVYARQGVDRVAGVPSAEARRSGRRRWRSLSRWASRIEAWWPGQAVGAGAWRERAHALLVGFVAGGGGRAALRARAVAVHALRGAAV